MLRFMLSSPILTFFKMISIWIPGMNYRIYRVQIYLWKAYDISILLRVNDVTEGKKLLVGGKKRCFPLTIKNNFQWLNLLIVQLYPGESYSVYKSSYNYINCLN